MRTAEQQENSENPEEVVGTSAAAAPQHTCQLLRGLRTMPYPDHRQELLRPQLRAKTVPIIP